MPRAPSSANFPALPPAPAGGPNDKPPVLLGDVPALLEGSHARPVIPQVGRALLIIWGVAIIGPVLGMNFAALESMALIATLAACVFVVMQGSSLRRETAALDELEALLALRRADEAAPQLHGLMSRPMRLPENRLRAMLLLGATLSRLDRTDDALLVYNELIETEGLAGPGGAVVKLARAMEMLRADHLYDADRAINDLRRLLDRGGAAAELKRATDAAEANMTESLGRPADDRPADGATTTADGEAATAGPPGTVLVDDRVTNAGVIGRDTAAAASPHGPADSPRQFDRASLAGLRLVELYRDVKTGHLAEALENFDRHLPVLKTGLGHRVGEAYALVALALHRSNRPAEAATKYADATALAPLRELVRRYPELWPLTKQYAATEPPR